MWIWGGVKIDNWRLKVKRLDKKWVLGLAGKSLILLSKSSRGVTVFLCGIAIALLGSFCHAPTTMLANFIATPIELSLIIPFLRMGEFMTGASHFPLTSDALKKVFTGEASKEVLLSIFHAILGWLVAVPFILAGLYVAFLPCFTILVHKFSTRPPSPKTLLTPLTEDLGESSNSVHV
ncbi:uncharacterized protein LOC132052128 isoform X2 [Lycium ferocissimum]|uniref:uncharacterized protein LOC132052128 isoform X2 n=1 Tax=Lycium ferocissimum TaxID=112874 RepID=UPI0028163419|nr:uncharacterized protein LOC132052128 isoform X2 [Lycium ferocissimum]